MIVGGGKVNNILSASKPFHLVPICCSLVEQIFGLFALWLDGGFIDSRPAHFCDQRMRKCKELQVWMQQCCVPFGPAM